MDRQKSILLEELGSIDAVNDVVASTYAAVSDYAATQVTRKVREHADADILLPRTNPELLEENHLQHARYMESVLRAGGDESVVDTVIWVYRTYLSHGFAPGYWPVQLQAWQSVLVELMPEDEYQSVAPYYEWLMRHHEAFLELARSRVSKWETRIL